MQPYVVLLRKGLWFTENIMYVKLRAVIGLVWSLLGEKFGICIWILLKFVLKDPFAMSALFQVMALHQTGIKPLNETIMNQFTDGYMYH